MHLTNFWKVKVYGVTPALLENLHFLLHIISGIYCKLPQKLVWSISTFCFFREGDDYEELEEDESIPMSEQELRSKVNKTIEKKQVSMVQQAATKSSTKDKRRQTGGRQSPLPSKKATAIKN